MAEQAKELDGTGIGSLAGPVFDALAFKTALQNSLAGAAKDSTGPRTYPYDLSQFLTFVNSLANSRSKSQGFGAKSQRKKTVLAQQAVELGKKTEALQKTIDEKSATDAERQELKKRIEVLSNDYKQRQQELIELKKQKDLGYLLDRVCSAATKKLMSDASFEKRFEEAKTCHAFVLAIDIRRSTDLMLRGKTPKQYADFLNAVCGQLVAVIKEQFGVVDKFTGDGLLAYFPDFFTGKDAGYRALSAAQACHAIFAQSYRGARSCFTVALKDVGLGIGIDFGEVHLLRITGELTVVVAPVVYACRLSGAPAGRTYVNHSAVAELEARCKHVFEASEIEFDVKHEGLVICQNVTVAPIRYEPVLPDWLSEVTTGKADRQSATPQADGS